ncbi:hypothetical protein NBRC116594_00290 [Shimia sp. NS0008-38b]|uniref:hypothetical protein n=1 Tax=Shimia sp. NS0008-38b TaxID=3127653 RepID=UPI00310A633F
MQFDLEQRLHLLAAFDQIGRARYLDVWKGTEAWARPAPSSAVETRATNEALKTELQKVIRKIATRCDLFDEAETQEERDGYSAQLSDLYSERSDLNKRIQELPDITDSQIEDAEEFDRRSTVEQELREAFARSDLLLYHGYNAIAQWNTYCETGQFEIRFDLSQVTVPEQYTNTPVQPAFVDRTAFKAWLRGRYKDTLSDPERLTDEARLAHWLKDQFAKDGQHRLGKDNFRTMASRELGITGVRLFDRVWGNEAPDSRKSSGRKRERQN